MLKDKLLEGYVALANGIERSQEKLLRKQEYRWIWIVVLGILVIAAAVAWVQCMNKGYRGFGGAIKLHHVWGIPVGIELGCY